MKKKMFSQSFALLALSALSLGFLSGCGVPNPESMIKAPTSYTFHGSCILEIKHHYSTAYVPVTEIRMLTETAKNLQIRIKGATEDFYENIETQNEAQTKKVLLELISSMRQCPLQAKPSTTPATSVAPAAPSTPVESAPLTPSVVPVTFETK